jgi:putative nucleotidyltransferase with HDIG domain
VGAIGSAADRTLSTLSFFARQSSARLPLEIPLSIVPVSSVRLWRTAREHLPAPRTPERGPDFKLEQKGGMTREGQTLSDPCCYRSIRGLSFRREQLASLSTLKILQAFADIFGVAPNPGFPRSLVFYVRAVGLLGLLFVIMGWLDLPHLPARLFFLILFVSLALLLLDIVPFRFTSLPVETTVADLAAVTSVILFQAPVSAIAVFFGKLLSELISRVRPLVAVFNISSYVVATYVSSLLLHRIVPPGYPRTLPDALLVLVFGTSFMVIHDGLISIAVHLLEGHRIMDLLENSTLFNRNLLFASLSIISGAIVLAYSLETRNIFAGGALAAVIFAMYAALKREEKIRQAIRAAVVSLNETIGARDEYTKDHCLRVAELARLTAHELNLGIMELELAEFAGMLHDLGKINFPDTLFTKKKLDETDWNQIRSHPEVGRQILESMEEFVRLQQVIALHHERCDGTGYPHGLKKHQIPLAARILALADSFDAMTSQRAYRKGFTPEFAVKEILAFRNTAFDPRITDAFLKVVCEKYGVKLPPVEQRVKKS